MFHNWFISPIQNITASYDILVKGSSIPYMPVAITVICFTSVFCYTTNVFFQGHMQWLFDHTSRRYLDLFAGIVTVSVGHCHP